MSRQNKANKTAYDQAGRLTPDEIATERVKQAKAAPRSERDRVRREARGTSSAPRPSTGSGRAEPVEARARKRS
jgi:hypothetical protein